MLHLPPAPRTLPRSPLRYVLAIVGIAVVDAVAMHGSMVHAYDGVSLYWLATGFNVGLIFLFGRRVLPAIVLAELLGPKEGLTFVIPAAAVAILAAAAGAAVLRRHLSERPMTQLRDVWIVALAAAPATAAVSAAGGPLNLALNGVPATSALGTVELSWFLGDYVGTLLGAPFLLALSHGVRRARDRRELVVWLTVIGAVVGGALLTLGSDIGGAYMTLPLLIWAGLRFGPVTAAGSALVIAIIAQTYTTFGMGPLTRANLEDGLIVSVAFLVIATMTALIVAAVSAERGRAHRRWKRSAREATALAAEHRALHQVADAIARERDLDEVMGLVCAQLGHALELSVSGVTRFADDGADGAGTVVWSWTEVGGPAFTSHSTVRSPLLQRLHEEKRTVFAGPEAAVPLPDVLSRAAAPIHVGGRLWGGVVAGGASATAVTEAFGPGLERFAELVGIAIETSENRAQLRAQATTDPLTGLLNHRAFRERLQAHADHARRHGHDLAVVVFDIDHFKAVNDAGGHHVGDEVLRSVAQRIDERLRAGDVAGRVGGDEIVLLLPDTDAAAAEALACDLRRRISAEPLAGIRLTVSAGIADLSLAPSGGDEMMRLADGALYWAKYQGRDACVRYSHDTVRELSAHDRAERLQRSQAMAGLRGLALAIDAKDALTRRHSERVADLTVALARATGWSDGDLARLREAAVLHDVGKIGVPDAILQKPGRLTDDEYAQIKTHAALSAEIAAEVLDDQQVAWVRGHHERYDGRGYPDGVVGDDLSTGAALLALADAWDAMTGARVYSDPMPIADALEECRDLCGRQFAPFAVEALERVAADGLPADAEALAPVA